jgi:hypothetical protein
MSLRAQFEEQWRQAEIPLIEARNAGHEFVFDELRERLERARHGLARSWMLRGTRSNFGLKVEAAAASPAV